MDTTILPTVSFHELAVNDEFYALNDDGIMSSEREIKLSSNTSRVVHIGAIRRRIVGTLMYCSSNLVVVPYRIKTNIIEKEVD